jgi:hypothetical protein
MRKTFIFLSLAFSLVSIKAQDAPRPAKFTYSVLPSKSVEMQNRQFHIVEIHSEYPIEILAGDCHNDYTVQWTCHFDQPADIFMRDLRMPPVFRTPRANTITILAKE